MRLLTHTPGTALLWLSHRLGAVHRWAVEAVTVHMGILKGTQGSVLVPKSHCLPPEPILSQNPLILSLRWDKNNKLVCPVSPLLLFSCVARPSMFLPDTEEGTMNRGLSRPCVPFMVSETYKGKPSVIPTRI